MKGIVTYVQWAVYRNWRANRAAYVALAIMSTMAFMSIALDRTSSRQLLSVVGGQESNQLRDGTRVLFALGIVVSVLQVQIVMSRLLQDRVSEFWLLNALGTSKTELGLIFAIENIVHATIGAAIGGLVSFALLLLIVPFFPTFGPELRADWYLPLGFSVLLPIVAVLPLAIGAAYHHGRRMRAR